MTWRWFLRIPPASGAFARERGSLAWFPVALSVLLALAFTAPAAARSLGDVDNDGIFTVMDLAKQIAAARNSPNLPEADRIYADVNADGVLNDQDSAEITKLILGTQTPAALAAASVRETSPAAGESGVALTREFVVRFTLPLALDAVVTTYNPNTQVPGHLSAEFGGRKLLTRAELSSDRLKATLFFLEPVPASARVRVTFDPTGLRDLVGRPLDPAADGVAGGATTYDYDTLGITGLVGTGVMGTVYGVDVGLNNASTQRPLAGVTITVDGAEETLRTTTDAQGKFTLTPAPSGRFFVLIDGRTAGGSGGYYAFVGKAWEGVPGRLDTPATEATANTVAGDIYLPFIPTGTLQTVSATQDTPVTFAPSVLAANPELADVRITIPANSLFADNGARGGQVGIAPVPPERLPEPLPPGLNLPLVITIQTDGVTNFDRPVPVRFPNLPDPTTGETLPPGAKSALWSFDHDTGHWEIAGPMTVSADGKFVETDAGVGVRQPGWHGANPGTELDCPPPLDGSRPPPVDCSPDLFGAAGKALEDNWADMLRCGSNLPIFKAIRPAFRCATRVGGEVSDGYSKLTALYDKSQKALQNSDAGSFGDAMSAVGIVTTGLYDTLSGCGEDFLSTLNLADAVSECASAAAKSAKSAAEEVERELKSRGCPRSENAGNLKDAAAAASDAIDGLNLWKKNRDKSNTIEQQWKSGADIASALINKIEDVYNKEQRKRSVQRSTAGNQELVELTLLLEQLIENLAIKREIVEQYKLFQSSMEDLVLKGNQDYEVVYSTGRMPLINDYYYLVSQGDLKIRGRHNGQLRVVLGQGSSFQIEYYDPLTKRYGYSFGKIEEGATGARILSSPLFDAGTDPVDFDSDGLSSFAENVIGTDDSDADTDGDGISDPAETLGGTNPLDGRPAAVGIIAAADTPGNALDIAVSDGLAAIADSDTGLTLFNTSNALNPIRTAQVDTPGSAQAVAFGSSVLAVADGSAGLAVVDVSDSPAAGIVHQISFGAAATSVATNGALAYVGLSDGSIAVVDLPSGTVSQRKDIASASIQDLVLGREVLYVLVTGTLYAVDLASGELGAVTSVASSGGVGAGNRRQRLSIGEDRLYATHTAGVNVFSLTNPLRPSLLRANSTTQFGWKQLVPNGSSFGIAAVSPNSTNDGPHDISLYTLGEDGGITFQTTIATPGLASAVAIYNGLAYVADGQSGLQIINYLAYDNKKVPPTISLAASFPLSLEAVVEEGKLARLSAAVADDVQVRNVEFLIDGQVAARDGGYPFEYRFNTPILSNERQSFTIQARAYDTGGNRADSLVYTVDIVPDATPPRVLKVNPEAGAIIGPIDTVLISFSEPLATATLGADTIRLFTAGVDGRLGTADDQPVVSNLIAWREATNSAVLSFPAPLAPGRYRVAVGTVVTDLAGNPLTAAATSDFQIFSRADRDRDGVPDDLEALLGFNPDNPDSNGNGVIDGREDADGDGLSTVYEVILGTDPLKRDTNGNGVADADEDSDLDGLSNQQEFALGTDPAVADTDGDGWNDEMDLNGGGDPFDPAKIPKFFHTSANFANAVTLTTGIVSQPELRPFRIGDPGEATTKFIATPPVSVLRAGAAVGETSTASAATIATPPITVKRP